MNNTAIPEECGKCIRCGNTVYMGLAHSCSTAVNLPAQRAEVVAPQRYDLYIDQGPGGHDYIEEMAAPKGDWVRWKDISSSYMNNGEGKK